MKFTAPKKLEILRMVLKEGSSVSSVAHQNGVSRKTLYAWKKKYLAAGPRNKSTCLEKRHLKGLQHPRGSRLRFKREVLRLVILHPEWGSHKISKLLKQKLGNNGVYTLLKGLSLETEAKRRDFGQSYRGPLRLLPEARKRMVERVVLGQEGATRTASEFLVSRKTLWKWTKRYKKSQEADLELINALKDQNPVGSAHPKGTPSWLEQKILDIVAQNPAYSSHKLAVVVSGIGNHGVQNVLLRNGLNTFDRRVEYAHLHTAAPASGIVVQPSAGWLNRLKTVWETFVPQMAPAPPPAVRQRVVSSVRAFAFSLISTSVFSLLLLFWLSMMGSTPTFGLRFGLFFASISLLIGTFFFLYSMKYYLTLALVLSFSTQTEEDQEAEKAESLVDVVEAKRSMVKSSLAKGWLGKIFGVSSDRRAESSGRRPAGGLQPNLDKVDLERYPFISVQLPFYNEKKVANRILSACTSFDYPNYEVLVCDDSTDETVDIVKEWEKHPKVKILHRPTREGFKGGALSYALKAMNPKTEFVVIFDADFVPYPDSLNQFIKYFKATGSWDEKKDYKANGIQTMPYDTLQKVVFSKEQMALLNKQEEELRKESDVAVVAGYQWHVLNKSENWITRGVRTEYAGSYVVERPGQEIMGAFKIIHGSVYCMRADVLKHFGWGTSITEDLELTLRIYQKGFKVIYTPYIQAPSECVSTIKRLIRQRMRWAEGHSFNVKKMFFKLMFSPQMTFSEKLEFLYISPYYLQAFFFLIGTFSWLVSETIFGARLPFWTSLWGWSLVLTNFFAMPLVNAVGLFLEESEEKDYLGLFSFIALSYLLVPFQAYAAIKGFIEPQEGTWFRTPKTGRITDVFARGRFYRWITGIIPGLRTAPAMHARALNELTSPYLALVTANNRFNNFSIRPKRARWIGKISVVMVIAFALLLNAVSLGQSLESLLSPQPIEMVKNNSQDFAFNGKDTFSQAETPKFSLMTPDIAVRKNSFLAKLISTKVEAAEPDITTTLIDNRGMEVTDTKPQITKGKDDYQLSFSQTTNLKPGKYTLKAKWKDNDGHTYTTKQDFRWGVLAINTNQSIYTPNQTAKFNFAVLDDGGQTLCQVEDLSLDIETPKGKETLSLANKGIQQSGKCQGNNLTDTADYLGELKVAEAGIYKLNLTAVTNNGTRSIEDQFEVRQSIPFEIERVSFPTRIILNHPYEVGLRIKANEDYQGGVEDSVPGNFKIECKTQSVKCKVEDGERKKISWEVNWQKGKIYTLDYTIEFPRISPQFYLVGPLKIGSFSEARSWQIAADVATVTRIDAGSDSFYVTTVYDNASANVTSDSTIVHTGPRSLKYYSDGVSNTWSNFAYGDLEDAGGRISAWFYFDSLPSNDSIILNFVNSAGSDQFYVIITSGGKLKLWNRWTNTQIGSTGTATISVDTWTRISVAFIITSQTVNDFKVWVNGGTADITVHNADLSASYPSGINTVFWGMQMPANWTGGAIYIDDFYMDKDTSLTDPGDIRVTAKLPSGDTTRGFDTIIGAGGACVDNSTEYGCVNERALSEAKGVRDNTRSAGTKPVENFAIQDSATGDVDISGNSYVAYQSWVWAERGGTSGTIAMDMYNNSATPIAITVSTTPALYDNTATSTSYPTDGEAVGLRGADSTTDSILYETGMQVAFSGAPVPEFALFLAPLSAFLPKIMHSLQKGTLVKDFKALIKTFVNKLGKLIEKFIFLRRRKQVLGKNKRKRNKSPG